MVKKQYLSAQGLLEDSFRLAVQVLNSGFRPTFMIAVWRGGVPKVLGLDYLIKHITHDDALLIVDDVFDTGRSVEAIIDDIKARARLNTPHDIRVAVPYYKPSRNETGRVPDYFVHETEAWLKYPHSLEGLSAEEIRDNRPDLYAILAPHLPNTES